MDAGVDDRQRYPTLGAAGKRMLDFLREHPAAPFFRNQSGNRLTAEDLPLVLAHEAEVLAGEIPMPGTRPPWLADFLAEVHAHVPFHRARGLGAELPTTCRADLARDIAPHVPDHVEVDRLINFRTTGTTGHPLVVASHPRVAASYLAFHKRALARVGITLRHGAGQVGVVLLGFQQKCFTYVSVTPTMGESGLAKINLHPADWRRAEDRATYLEALGAEVLAGDPLSFAALLELDVQLRPRAILSTSMRLGPGLRQALEARFACPVLDLYSLNEAGPIGVYDPELGGHVLLQPRLLVEILDPDGRPLPAGTRGEITLTGGFNFCLPLVRYRTGDHAALEVRGGQPVLIGLDGRRAVRFRHARGHWLNNIDVTHALAPLALRRYAVHQEADGRISARVTAGGDPRPVLEALLAQPVRVSSLEDQGQPGAQYSSDLAGAEPA